MFLLLLLVRYGTMLKNNPCDCWHTPLFLPDGSLNPECRLLSGMRDPETYLNYVISQADKVNTKDK